MDKIDELRRHHVRQAKARHDHAFAKVDTEFSQCQQCRLLQIQLVPSVKFLFKLPAILKGRRLPPTDKQGRYHTDILVGDYVKVRRLFTHDDLFFLFVDIPGEGWKSSQIFHALQWDRLLSIVEKVGDKDPRRLFLSLRESSYGEGRRTKDGPHDSRADQKVGARSPRAQSPGRSSAR